MEKFLTEKYIIEEKNQRSEKNGKILNVDKLIPRKPRQRRSYLNPIFGGVDAAATAGVGRRWPGGRVTKIPYFLGGGSGGKGGGNDGSSICTQTTNISTNFRFTIYSNLHTYKNLLIIRFHKIVPLKITYSHLYTINTKI